jgi:hypothetical protein
LRENGGRRGKDKPDEANNLFEFDMKYSRKPVPAKRMLGLAR